MSTKEVDTRVGLNINIYTNVTVTCIIVETSIIFRGVQRGKQESKEESRQRKRRVCTRISMTSSIR